MDGDESVLVRLPDDERIEYTRALTVEQGDHGFVLQPELKYEILTVQSGEGAIVLDGKRQKLRAGDRRTIKHGFMYEISSNSKVVILIFGITDR
jgi:mannose-6-phosphate isomerase-like protein (cupin superfamily)